MFTTKSQKTEELDRAGKLILNAATAGEAEVEAAVSSPFLFTRISAAIAEERRAQEQAGSWSPLILVAKRAVPAMALVTILTALLTLWPTLFGSASMPGQPDDEVLFGPAEPGVEQTVLATTNGLSRDDVFNIVVDRNYGK